MIKFLRRAVILLFVFVLGVAGSSFLLNSETTDDRSDMNDPVFPEVMVDFDGIMQTGCMDMHSLCSLILPGTV